MSDDGQSGAELASPACLMHEADTAYMFAADLPDLAGRPVMLFDGVCVLCSRGVRFVLRHERDHAILFAPMQSRAGQMLLARHGLPPRDWDSFVLIDGDRALIRSRAAFAVARHLRAPWRWLGITAVVPRPLADRFYDWIARNRYRWFGRNDACFLPAPAERARFLD